MNTARAGTLAGVAVLSGLAVLSGPPVLSVPGGLLLAFVLPGVAITQATFRPGRLDIGVVERFVLIPAVSLAVLVLGGLGLWAAGGSLNRAGWLSLSLAATLAGLGVAVLRARRATAADDPAATRILTAARGAATRIPAAGAGATGDRPRVTRRRLVRDILPLTLAVALIGGVGWWSYGDSDRAYDERVTSLSAAPPGAADPTGDRTVQITAAGLDPGAGPYRLVVTGASGEQLGEQDVTPGAGGDWTGGISVPGAERVTVSLFRGTDTTEFRTLIIAAAR